MGAGLVFNQHRYTCVYKVNNTAIIKKDMHFHTALPFKISLVLFGRVDIFLVTDPNKKCV